MNYVPVISADEKSDIKPIVYGLISIPVIFTLVGVVYMCRSICFREIREKCCTTMEKEDINNDYGEYYEVNGERRTTVMEVTFVNSISDCWPISTYWVGPIDSQIQQVEDRNPAYETTNIDSQASLDDYDYMGDYEKNTNIESQARDQNSLDDYDYMGD